jgi:hypothetical protein
MNRPNQPNHVCTADNPSTQRKERSTYCQLQVMMLLFINFIVFSRRNLPLSNKPSPRLVTALFSAYCCYSKLKLLINEIVSMQQRRQQSTQWAKPPPSLPTTLATIESQVTEVQSSRIADETQSY